MIYSLKALINKDFVTPTCIRICDTLVLIVYCRQHGTIIIHRQEQKPNNAETINDCYRSTIYRWFPYINTNSGMSLYKCALDVASIIFKTTMIEDYFLKMEIISIYTLELPYYLDEVFRYIMLVIPKPEVQCNCQIVPYEITLNENDSLEWINLSSAHVLSNPWGPEVSYFTAKLLNIINTSSIELSFSHYGLNFVTKMLSPIDSRTIDNYEEEMIQNAHVNDEQVLNLFKSFIETVYPSFVMNRSTFYRFIMFHEFECQPTRIINYFNSFAISNKYFITFHELLVGLVSIDPKTILGESRLRLIFRFYDRDRDGILSVQEFKELVHDLHPEMSQERTATIAENILQTICLAFSIQTTKIDSLLTFSMFFNSIKRKIIIGVSNLCRSNNEIFPTVQWLLATIDNADNSIKSQNCDSILCETFSNLNQTESSIQEPKHYFVDEIIINSDGHIDAKDCSSNIIKIVHRFLNSISQSTTLRNIFTFDKTSSRSNSVALQMSEIKLIFDTCKSFFQLEKNIVEFNYDCFVLGDLHGQIEHLITLGRSLWPLFPVLEGQRIIFIGNYIHPDQNKSFILLIYLFCLKILAPTEVIILRGRSEIQESESNKALKQHLSTVLEQQEMVNYIYDELNDVLSNLPIGAIIREKILCCTGGVPTMKNSTTTVLELNYHFPKPNPKFVKHGPTNPLWQMIWNVPLKIPMIRQFYQSFVDELNLDKKDKDQLTAHYQNGFVANMKSLNNYFYSKKATDHFLETSNLSHIIATNPDAYSSFEQMFQNKLLLLSTCPRTSSSSDSGLTNETSTKCSPARVISSIEKTYRKTPLNNANNRPETPSSYNKIDDNFTKLYLLHVSNDERLITLFVYESDKQRFLKEPLSLNIKN